MSICGRRRQLLCCVLVLSGLTATSWLTSAQVSLVSNRSVNPPVLKGRTINARSGKPKIDSSLKTLRFEVCNGYTNQRLAVLYGVLLAKLLGRAVVLPDLITNGRQATDLDVQANADNRQVFEDAYDSQYFKEQLAAAGIVVMSQDEAPPANQYTQYLNWPRPLVQHLDEFPSDQHLSLGCTLFKFWKQEIVSSGLTSLMWKVLDSLKPAPAIAAAVDAGVKVLTSNGAGQGFNFLHIRIEEDWIAHCKRWQAIRDGIPRDNCFGAIAEIGRFLLNVGLDPKLPLYVATYWADAPQPQVSAVLKSLVSAGFNDIRKRDDVFKGDDELDRESAAAVDFHIAERAEKFVGNSVATFSALMLLQRWHESRFAAFYNGGSIPLADMLPVEDVIAQAKGKLGATL